MKIIFRDIFAQIKRNLPSDEVILLIGARQAGKTTILKYIQEELTSKGKRTFFLSLEDPDYLGLLNRSPKNLFQIFPIDLKSQNYILIDEIQYLKNPSNFLKFFYDLYKDKIKIIATGSSAFYMDKKFKDSLAGRKKIYPVRTLSFREFLRFKEADDLIPLPPENFSARNYLLTEKISLHQKEQIRNFYTEFLIYGGYPRVALASLSDKISILQDIAYSYIKKDIFESNIRQDEVFYRLFKLLCSQIGNVVNTNELSNTLGVSRKAILNYLYVMQKSFHIILLRPFYKNVRKELTRMPKVYFYDLGLRNFFANNFESIHTRADRGALLENGVIRQLIERAGDLIAEKIKFWRATTGAEVDIIYDDKYAFEVKFESRLFKEGKYKQFFERYPAVAFNIVSFSGESSGKFPVWEPWLI